jgi:transposase
MKYQQWFKIHDNPQKIYLRMKIIKDYQQGMNLTQIFKAEKCTIKTSKKWVDKYTFYIEQGIENKFNVSAIRKRKISIPFKVQQYII